ncbi:hypothetical protein BDV26DRAFT_288443 [Aspergillus bertholletiae]|uniref:SMP-30/Gluconolactonase/LRE-like region domain-containing protein n=1 Tax=Aspergillus bertholletiae TaxID=1226010 RepID=A0A5N7BKT4_9EURO|nr:hypothetical protein BDV26DRAFT_288443 [Aspergillus bertholletiae]
MSSAANQLFPGVKQLPHKFLVSGMYFGESPRFHNGILYVSDMTGCRIYTIDTSSGDKQILLEVENQPNGMCIAADGSLIYSSMFDAKLYRFRDGTSELYADMSHVMTGYCGDMVIDRSGRVYVDDVGARVLHGEQPKAGRLLSIETDGTVKVAVENLNFPNALMINSSGKSLILAETFAQQLTKYDIGNDGTLHNRQIIWSPPPPASLDDQYAVFSIDGGCMDAEDGMWLSMLSYERFIRLDAEGHITHQIKVDGHATACTLGGEDGKTLYLLTNKAPEDEGHFRAMANKRTKCTVSTARVDIPRGAALP